MRKASDLNMQMYARYRFFRLAASRSLESLVCFRQRTTSKAFKTLRRVPEAADHAAKEGIVKILRIRAETSLVP